MQHHFGNVVPTASSFLLKLLMDVLPKLIFKTMLMLRQVAFPHQQTF